MVIRLFELCGNEFNVIIFYIFAFLYKTLDLPYLSVFYISEEIIQSEKALLIFMTLQLDIPESLHDIVSLEDAIHNLTQETLEITAEMIKSQSWFSRSYYFKELAIELSNPISKRPFFLQLIRDLVKILDHPDLPSEIKKHNYYFDFVKVFQSDGPIEPFKEGTPQHIIYHDDIDQFGLLFANPSFNFEDSLNFDADHSHIYKGNNMSYIKYISL